MSQETSTVDIGQLDRQRRAQRCRNDTPPNPYPQFRVAGLSPKISPHLLAALQCPLWAVLVDTCTLVHSKPRPLALRREIMGENDGSDALWTVPMGMDTYAAPHWIRATSLLEPRACMQLNTSHGAVAIVPIALSTLTPREVILGMAEVPPSRRRTQLIRS